MIIEPTSQPIDIFKAWMDEAKKQPGIREATAMAVSTLSGQGQLHSRVVLCKDWTAEGFTFFSNYKSRKGLDLQQNAQASAVFYWDPMFRQVCISGKVSRTSRQVSEEYWNSRPRASQLSQWISRQSQEASSREELERLWQEADHKFTGKQIPCPEHWGGYLLVMDCIEFWLGQANRLHDRYEFQKSGNHWTFRRLYP